MMRKFILLCLLMPLHIFSQEYSYTHYDLKEGLAGSVAYCMAQDKDGFLWIGTETGLSRFDGTHFKNYFKADGLTENPVLKLYVDSKNRVWIAPFHQSICYYYNGKIYNRDNDPLPGRFHIKSFITRIAEDDAGNILMMENTRLHLLQANGQVVTFDKIGNDPITDCISISRNTSGGFWVVENKTIYELKNNQFRQRKKVDFCSVHTINVVINDKDLLWRKDTLHTAVGDFLSDQYVLFPFRPAGHMSICLVDKKTFAMCNADGVHIYDRDKPNSPLFCLPHITVSNVFRDSEGSFWFTTIGHGLYRLNSIRVTNLKLKDDEGPAQQVFCFARDRNSVVVGAEKNVIYRFNISTEKFEKEHVVFPPFPRDPFVAIYVYGYQKLIYASRHIFVKLTEDYKIQKQIVQTFVKTVSPYKNCLLAATSKNVLLVEPASFTILDTIWRERATTVFASHDTIYIGALRGLYCLYPGKPAQYLGEGIPVFRNLITAITKDSNNILWIATSGEGVVGYKNGRVIAYIDQQKGLTSNTCRAIYASGNSLWIGTDRGLNKIDLSKAGYPVQKYTTADGLASDMINALYVEENKVCIGTSEGLSFFDDQKMHSYSRCDLLFTDVTISGRSRLGDSTWMHIPHFSNNIRFDYAGISYKSAGDIRYRYRLLGLDSNWNETRETFLSYPTLPSGDYELQLQAINKFEVSSRIITAKFTIEKLLWEKTWFRLLVAFVFLGLTGLLVWTIVYRIRKREEEKTVFNKRIGDLEQLARKAQMNPHFIFNSLNSIQQYVMDADLAGANKFISGFSRLIRQTLDFSSKQEISLEEEMDYLTNYLELERTRLEGAFSWSVDMAENIDPAEYYLPPMILQPYVENSVRHGLRYRKDRQGKLLISIQKKNTELVCIVEDNGVGRSAAQKLKSNSHIEYQSKGMSLTADRVALLNRDNPHKITVHIDDLEDEQQNALGTRVIITFPIT